MKTSLQRLFGLSLGLALPALVHAGGDACAAAAKDADGKACCPATGAVAKAAADTCPAQKNDKLTRASFKVSGMTCAACETKLTKALNGIEGVVEPSACSKSKLAKVAYDSAKVKEERLIAAIQDAGFKVDAEIIQVKLSGLKCDACSDKVSKKLASVKGVSEQKVCHESQEAVVTFNPKEASRKDILAAIDSTGFKTVQ